ncbi:MAG: hypothetical protein WAO93_09535 [Orrella sp.]|uniref:hypothetical protein n=1 Tax=Orrella sp. TaxID=1921583 RepID=UPI003BBFAB62
MFTVRTLLLSVVLLSQMGCAVAAVADAFVSVVSTTVEVTADVVGAAVDAVIPD